MGVKGLIHLHINVYDIKNLISWNFWKKENQTENKEKENEHSVVVIYYLPVDLNAMF